MKKFVITGAPGTGKTTIINALKQEDITALTKYLEK